MPVSAMIVPMRQAEDRQAIGGVHGLEELRAGERRLEERLEDVVDEGDLDEAADDREDREAGHRDLHRGLALGDVVVGAREADVGVLDLAGDRVRVHVDVVEVALLELARLGHRVVRNARKIIRNV